MIILSPEGKARLSDVQVSQAPLVFDLNGKVLGVLDNGKPNADALATRFEELLHERYQIARVVRRRKISAQQAAPGQYIVDLAAEADFIINGLGD